MVLGFFCIVTGIVFLIDFLFAVKNTRFTVTTTTVTRNEFTTWNIFLSTYLKSNYKLLGSKKLVDFIKLTRFWHNDQNGSSI